MGTTTGEWRWYEFHGDNNGMVSEMSFKLCNAVILAMEMEMGMEMA